MQYRDVPIISFEAYNWFGSSTWPIISFAVPIISFMSECELVGWPVSCNYNCNNTWKCVMFYADAGRGLKSLRCGAVLNSFG